MENDVQNALFEMQRDMQGVLLQHERELRVMQAILMAMTQQPEVNRSQLLLDADAALGSQYDRLESTHWSRSHQSDALTLLYQWLGNQSE